MLDVTAPADEIGITTLAAAAAAVAAANAAGKPCLSVGSGNAPVYMHRSADILDCHTGEVAPQPRNVTWSGAALSGSANHCRSN